MPDTAELVHITDRSWVHPEDGNIDEALSDAVSFVGVLVITVRDVVLTGVLDFGSDGDSYALETAGGAALEFHRDHVNRIEFYTQPKEAPVPESLTLTSKEFPVGTVLTITTGKLIAPNHIDGVYEILNFMTRDNLFTHQLPRVAREVEPILRAQLKDDYPGLEGVEVPEGLDTTEKIDAWLAPVIAKYGAMIKVHQVPEIVHTRIDPLSELAMHFPDKEVIIVQTDKADLDED